MNHSEKILQILNGIKPNKDMSKLNDIIEGGYLDSFELMSLISQLSDTFGIEIGIEDIDPENFNSIEAMTKMVDRLVSGK